MSLTRLIGGGGGSGGASAFFFRGFRGGGGCDGTGPLPTWREDSPTSASASPLGSVFAGEANGCRSGRREMAGRRDWATISSSAGAVGGGKDGRDCRPVLRPRGGAVDGDNNERSSPGFLGKSDPFVAGGCWRPLPFLNEDGEEASIRSLVKPVVPRDCRRSFIARRVVRLPDEPKLEDPGRLLATRSYLARNCN